MHLFITSYQKKIAVIATIVLLLVTSFCYPQSSYHSVWYSSDSNHLPQNSVKSIIEDKYGYIWLSTENGVVRYDGQNFKIFNLENVRGMKSNRMRLFSGDREKDSIIITNDRDEILLINKRSLSVIRDNRKRDPVHTEINRHYYLLYPGYENEDFKSSYAIRAGSDTYVIGDGKVRVYNRALKLKKQFSSSFTKFSRLFISNQHLYILDDTNRYASFDSTEKVWQKLDDTKGEPARIYNNLPAQQSFLLRGKKLYLITNNGTAVTTRLLLDGFNLDANNIVSVYYDVIYETLFLGSANKGLVVIKNHEFKHNTTPFYHKSGTDNVYYAMTAFSNKGVLTSTGEIFYSDGNTSLINIGEFNDKYRLAVDYKGDIWTKKEKSIFRLHKKSNYTTFEQWDLPNSVITMSPAPDGKIWISSFGKSNDRGILYLIDPYNTKSGPKKKFDLDYAVSEIKDIDGETMWTGSWKGLFKINLLSGEATNIKGIPYSHVRNIYSTSASEAWVGTYGKGFYLYRNNQATHFPLDKNQHLLTVHCIIEDREGIMWITTNKGLFAASKKDLYAYADKKIDKIYYHIFDKSAGFLNNEFNGGCSPCGVYLNRKELFFPSMEGIVYFDPANVKKRLPVKEIYIDNVIVDKKTFKTTDSLVFKRGFERLQFHVSSPFFGHPYNQNIEVCLEGPVTQKWGVMTENNISFSTLPPGSYTLKTRKLGGFGSKWITKELNFEILPAFWQTTWFSIILLITGLGMLYCIYILRISYIRHKNIQLEKQVLLKTEQLQNTVKTLRKTQDELSNQVTNHKALIKIITHDIKSPLKFMAITGRYLYNNINKPDLSLRDDIKAMHTSSSQLYNFVDNFLAYAKETNLNITESTPYLLNALVDEKVKFFENIARSEKNTIVNHVGNDITVKVNRQLLSIILHNLLDNALKNTVNGTITFSTIQTSETTVISVSDTGKGMPEDVKRYFSSLLKKENNTNTIHDGMGLKMIIDLLAVMGGTMTIDSSENMGTLITLSFYN